MEFVETLGGGQWAETLLEIRGTLADIKGTTKLPNRGAYTIFPNMNLTGLYV